MKKEPLCLNQPLRIDIRSELKNVGWPVSNLGCGPVPEPRGWPTTLSSSCSDKRLAATLLISQDNWTDV